MWLVGDVEGTRWPQLQYSFQVWLAGQRRLLPSGASSARHPPTCRAAHPPLAAHQVGHGLEPDVVGL